MPITSVNPPRRRKSKTKAKKKTRRKTARKRKWGSPAQRAAFAKMRAARRSSSSTTTRRKKKTTRRTSSGGKKVARKRRTTRRAPTRRRRTYSRRGFAGAKGILIEAGGGTAGVMLAQQVIPRLPIPENMKTPTGSALVQIGLGIAVATLGKKVFGKHARSMGVGICTAGGVQLANSLTQQANLSGLAGLNVTPALTAGNLSGLDITPAMDDGLGADEYQYIDD